MVAAYRDKVGAIGGEGAIPDPALVAVKGRVQGKGVGSSGDHLGRSRFGILHASVGAVGVVNACAERHLHNRAEGVVNVDTGGSIINACRGGLGAA